MPTYACIVPLEDKCILLVLHPNDTEPERHEFTECGFVEGGAGQWLNLHERYAKTIPYISFFGLMRARVTPVGEDANA